MLRFLKNKLMPVLFLLSSFLLSPAKGQSSEFPITLEMLENSRCIYMYPGKEREVTSMSVEEDSKRKAACILLGGHGFKESMSNPLLKGVDAYVQMKKGSDEPVICTSYFVLRLRVVEKIRYNVQCL